MNDAHPPAQAIVAARRKDIPGLLPQGLDAGETAGSILENRLVPGMAIAGEKFFAATTAREAPIKHTCPFQT
jgi:hypothetical protein